MKKQSQSNKLVFEKAVIAELNDNQLASVYGADLISAVQSAVVSFVKTMPSGLDQAVGSAMVTFAQTMQLP